MTTDGQIPMDFDSAASGAAGTPAARRLAAVRAKSASPETELERLRALRRQHPNDEALRFQIAHLASRLGDRP